VVEKQPVKYSPCNECSVLRPLFNSLLLQGRKEPKRVALLLQYQYEPVRVKFFSPPGKEGSGVVESCFYWISLYQLYLWI